MKKTFLKAALAVLISCMGLTAFGQASGFIYYEYEGTDKTDNSFYANLDDYKNNKPIAGYEIVPKSWKTVFGVESFEVKTSKGTERVTMAKMPSKLVTYGSLVRIYNSNIYRVIAYGDFCVYYFFQPQQQGNNFRYSETITGDLKKYSKKVFNQYLIKCNLLESYQKELKDVNTTPEDAHSKHQERIRLNQDYYKQINQKLAEQKK